MITVFISNGVVTGFNETVTEEGLANYPLDYVRLESLEDKYKFPAANEIVHYDKDSGEFSIEVVEPPQPPIDELAQLKQDNEKLKQDMAEQTAAILDIFNIILGGN